MEILKSHWISDGDRISLSVPFVKVDEERRIVSGFATLDNVDKHGDIVDTSASMTAFSRFRGNIREMHQPIAVGKVVSFRQEDFYDKSTDKTYSGVFVDVYVSKGAQDTWEKVLDGTLSGFSIGGNINKSDSVMDEDHESTIRLIKDYDLVELSLVDNPANQLANVFSIQKADIGFTVSGMATEIKADNVFYCDVDEIALAADTETKSCAICSNDMTNIGWVEDIFETKAADIAKVVNNYIEKATGESAHTDLSAETTVAKDINGEGGSRMPQSEEITAEAVVEEEIAKSEEVVETETAEVAEDVIEKSEEVAEVETEEVSEESDFAKMLDDLKTFVTDSVSKAYGPDGITEIRKAVDEMAEQMSARHDEMTKAVEEVRKEMGTIVSRVNAIEATTATKKSNDFDESKETITKSQQSIWKGHFLGVHDL